MLIGAKLRPRGIKRGVSTKSLYKSMGFKPDVLDIRDVVGTLELSARRPSDTLFLAAMHKCLSDFYPNPDGYYLKIFNKDGEECFGAGAELTQQGERGKR